MRTLSESVKNKIDEINKKFDDDLSLLRDNKLNSLKSLLNEICTDYDLHVGDYVEVINPYYNTLIAVAKIADVSINENGLPKFRVSEITENLEKVDREENPLKDNLSIPLSHEKLRKIQDINKYFQNVTKDLFNIELKTLQKYHRKDLKLLITEYSKSATGINVKDNVMVLTENGEIPGIIHDISTTDKAELIYIVDVDDIRSKNRMITCFKDELRKVG